MQLSKIKIEIILARHNYDSVLNYVLKLEHCCQGSRENVQENKSYSWWKVHWQTFTTFLLWKWNRQVLSIVFQIISHLHLYALTLWAIENIFQWCSQILKEQSWLLCNTESLCHQDYKLHIFDMTSQKIAHFLRSYTKANESHDTMNKFCNATHFLGLMTDYLCSSPTLLKSYKSTKDDMFYVLPLINIIPQDI